MKVKLKNTIERQELKQNEFGNDICAIQDDDKEIPKLISNYVKTTITRDKLYKRNYTRDYIEIVNTTNRAVSKEEHYKSLIDILVNEYLDSKKSS